MRGIKRMPDDNYTVAKIPSYCYIAVFLGGLTVGLRLHELY